ncbi:MAG: response regulator [Methanosarcinales archaeon]|nr:MAG: response regulator [Methanosarcinales archaeon]
MGRSCSGCSSVDNAHDAVTVPCVTPFLRPHEISMAMSAAAASRFTEDATMLPTASPARVCGSPSHFIPTESRSFDAIRSDAELVHTSATPPAPRRASSVAAMRMRNARSSFGWSGDVVPGPTPQLLAGVPSAQKQMQPQPQCDVHALTTPMLAPLSDAVGVVVTLPFSELFEGVSTITNATPALLSEIVCTPVAADSTTDDGSAPPHEEAARGSLTSPNSFNSSAGMLTPALTATSPGTESATSSGAPTEDGAACAFSASGADAATAVKAVSLDHRLHVLAADDDSMMRRLLQRHLDALGHGAVVVRDGRDVLNKLLASNQLPDIARAHAHAASQQVVAVGSEAPFDLLLLDIMMTDLHGDETCQLLRQAGFRLPILAVTANAVVVGEEKLLRLGFDAVVPKPFTRAQLGTAIHRVASSSHKPPPAHG